MGFPRTYYRKCLNVIVTGILLVSFLVTPLLTLVQYVGAVPPDWWNTDWQFRKAVTIDHTKVDAHLEDFPALIKVVDSDLSSKAQLDGDDIAFTDESGVQLSHEIEFYDSSTGHLIAWVKVPSLSAITDTVFYMYYGNAGAANQENPHDVWDSNYMMVQHLNETYGSTCYDSTMNGNDGTLYNVFQGAAGRIDGAYEFNGATSYVEMPHSDTLAGFTQGFTASVWFSLGDTRRQSILHKYDTTGNRRGWFVEYRWQTIALLASPDGTNFDWWYAAFTPVLDTWYYLTVVWQANAVPKFYINGQQLTTIRSGTISGINNNVGIPLHIGKSTYYSGREFRGGLDEIRLSNAARSSSWILTSYNNQEDPSTFYAVGPEENQGSEAIMLSDENPPNGATNTYTNPELSIHAINTAGRPMTIIFSTNASGTWTEIKRYTDVGNGIYSCIPTDMKNLGTKCYWSVDATDGTNSAYGLYSLTTTTTILSPKWTRSDFPEGESGVLIADVNGDGLEEVIKAGAGWIHMLNGKDGSVLWQLADSSLPTMAKPQMADLNKDGILEIIVNIAYGVMAIHANDGTIYWKRNDVSGGNHWSSPVVADIDGNGYPTVFVASEDITNGANGLGRVSSLSHDGQILHQTFAWRPCFGGLSIADADNDGEFELFMGDRNSNYGDGGYGRGVQCFWAKNLTVKWERPEVLCSSHIPLLADVNKDGLLEVMAGQNAPLYVLDPRDGSIVNYGSSSTNFPIHFQPSICDIDLDGNLEILMADGHDRTSDDIVVWDLFEWKLDGRMYCGKCYYGPKVADVTGDGIMEIIACSYAGVHVFDNNYSLIAEATNLGGLPSYSRRLTYAVVQDIDGDGYNELVVSSYNGNIFAFDTPARRPNPRPRSEVQYYSEQRLGAAVYLPPPGGSAPQVLDPVPPNGATEVPVSLSQLTFRLADFQNDPMDYTIITVPDIGAGSGLGVTNGIQTVGISGLAYNTLYTWKVNVTDGVEWTNRTFTFTTEATQTWWNTDWQYRKTITIDPAKVTADQTNFPVLIDLTDSTLTSKAQSDGDDFVFTNANQVKLNHEIELYDSTTGHLIVWVNVPFLSSTTFTILYMYYGNPTAENQQNPTAVWDTSYKMVLHLNEESAPEECRLWGIIADSLPENVVLNHLVNGDDSLKKLGDGRNPDGWGLAYYNTTNGNFTVFRGAPSASTDSNFNVAAAQVAASGESIAIGHVRDAGSGASDIPDPHPFIRYRGDKWWALGHNGVLSKTVLKNLIGETYLSQFEPLVGEHWDDPDVVDSDLYLIYLLKCMETMDWDVIPGLARAITDISEADPGRNMNFFLTDGEKLWGFRRGDGTHTLYYYNETFPLYSALASQPPDPSQIGWVYMDNYNLVTLTTDSPPYIIDDIREYVPVPQCFDSTIHGNNGTIYEGVIQGVTGKIDGACEFDGTSGYIEVPHSGTITGFTEAFTASFWLKLEDTTRRQAILNKYDTAGSQRGWFIEFQTHGTYGKVLGFFASEDGVNYSYWFASFNPTAGAWYYITVVWEANTIPKFYVDGVQVPTINSDTIAFINNNTAAPLHIGRSTYATGRYLAGSLDEIRISNPTRSATYILTCFNNQKGPSTFYTVGPEESLATEPIVSNPDPANGATNVPVTLTELSFNLTDYQGDPMDYYVSTYPDVGLGNATGVYDGRYSLSISDLEYSTPYTWHVNVTDGTHWTNRTYTFTTQGQLLVDSEFNDSVDSADLRLNNATIQDWYESRETDPDLLTLDTSDVDGNTGKKARFAGSDAANAYLTQEFSSPQTGVFIAEWDIYIDEILDTSAPDRAGWMLIGDDTDSTRTGPNSDDSERFVYMGFFRDGGGTSGTMDLVARDRDDGWTSFTTIASGLNLKQWYTIRVVVNITAGTYDVYVDGEFKLTVTARHEKTSVTHISFAQWNDGAGTFYVDNVFASVQDQYTLNINIVGSGSVVKNPDQATYAYGTEVTLTAFPADSWTFSGWSGDLISTENPVNITMNGDKTVTATFTEVSNTPPEATDLSISPEYPTTTDDLIGNYTYYDEEGDPEDGTEICWYKNGVLQPELNGTLAVPSSYTSKGEVWNFTVTPKDGKDFGELKTSPSITIQNSQPTIDSYHPEIDPTISEGQKQEFNITYSDLDNDEITIHWYLNDISVANDTASYTFNATAGSAGVYNVTVVISDGSSQDMQTWTLTVVVGNAPPAAYDLSITPSSPTTLDDLNANYTYFDSDDDPENGTEIRWYKDGVLQPELNDSKAVPASLTMKGETWYFTVKPKDGKDFGELETSPSVTIVNSPPSIDSYTPEDTAPEVYENSTLAFTHTSSDPDNDTLTYSWLLDGTEHATTPNWTYKPGFDEAGFHNVTLVVSDAELFATQYWNVTVINVNQAPTITDYYPETDPEIEEGESQEFNITCNDPDGDDLLIQWYLDSAPVGTTNSTSYTYTSGSAGTYNVTVIVSDGLAQASHEWTLTVTQLQLLVDSEFNDSFDSDDLRADGSGQDWYESRNDDPNLLTLDESDVGGNAGKKAALENYDIAKNAYLTQEFSSAQTGTFTISFDIYIDRIFDYQNYDRTGLIYIGDDRITTNCPTGTSNERFVFMAFYDPTPGDTGNDLEIRARTASGQTYATTSQWLQVVSGLSYDTWYTIKIVVNVASGTYDVYIDGQLVKSGIPKYSGYTPNSVTHISFSADSEGRGDFYVDNVFAPAQDRYNLTVNIDGNGSVEIDPGEATYANGTVVTLTAVPADGWMFSGWTGDLSVTDNPVNITMDGDKAVTALFTQIQYIITASAGEGGVIIPTGDVVVAHGADQAFTITPDTGYHILDVLVDSVSVGAVSEYTFYAVYSNHTIEAQFALDEYSLTITISPEGSGSVSLNDTEPYHYGDVIELTAVPAAGWAFSEWKGDLTGSTNPDIIIMDGDKVVNATFILEQLLVDSEFDDSVDSADLRANATGQDWYESRDDVPELLTLNDTDIGGNAGKKAALENYGIADNAYLTQEFSSAQTGTFSVSFDIYIDKIEDSDNYDRSGLIYIGYENPGGTNGPCSTSTERFVFLTFYDSTPGDTGSDLEIRARTQSSGQPYDTTSSWISVATGLSYDTWYTIKIVVNVTDGTYDVYVDDVLRGDDISGYSGYASSSVTHISFSADSDGRGDFYVDNVFSPAQNRYRLTVNTVGNGTVEINPGESTYAIGTNVTLTANADPGWSFSHWTGDITGTDNPATINMTGNMAVTAWFTQDYYTLNVTVVGDGSVTVDPDQPTYTYGQTVNLNATASTGWSFTGWSGDLTGDENPATINMTRNMTVTATFTRIEYALTVNIEGNGQVSRNDTGPYYYGSTVELTATADAGWSFSEWSGDLSGTDNPAIIVIDGNKTVIATFTQDQYTLEITIVGSGSVTKDPDKAFYTHGENVTLTAYPDTGWSFFEWTGDITETVNPINITIDANKTITATFTRIEYTLTVTIVGNGSVNLNTTGPYYHSTPVELTANPDLGWTFTNWSGDITSTENPTTIIMDSNKTVTATFTQTEYTLTVTVSPEDTGTVALNNTGPYYYGDVIELEAIPTTGWAFSHWTGDLEGGLNPTTILIDGNKTVTAVFAQDQYYLTINTEGSGTVTKQPDQASYSYGTNVTLTAIANAGWSFSHWTGDLSGTENPATINMTANMTITAYFTQEQYTLTIRIIGSGSVSIFSQGQTITLTANADPGWSFTEWTGDLTGNQNPIDIVMDSDKYVTATFTQDQYTLTINIVGEGSITKDPDKPTYTYGETVTLTANPQQGWQFSSWSGDITETETPITITIDANKTITATFTRIEYTLNVSIVGSGSVSLNTTGPYYYGSAVQLTANADPGWSFFEWSGDLSGSTNPAVIIMDENKSITATFTQKEYTLTVNIVGNGSVARDPDQATYVHGTEVNLTAVAESGWTFSGWSGDLTGIKNPINITMNSNKTVSATFTQILLVDSEFNDSTDSTDLRTDGSGQDWYESRNDDPTLLTLNDTDIGDNAGKKAALENYGIADNAYLTQEFSSAQTDVFSVSFDIYIDRIEDSDNYDRSGLIYIGYENPGGTNGPCSTSTERFVFLTFYDSTPGDTGSDLEIRARTQSSGQPYDTTSSWISVATGLSYDTWYTIKIVLNVTDGTYDVYVDGTPVNGGISKYSGYTSSSITHISFSADSDGRGGFYVDNVFSPAQQTNGGGGYPAANSNDTSASYMANTQYLPPVFLLVAVLVAFSLRKNKRKRK